MLNRPRSVYISNMSDDQQNSGGLLSGVTDTVGDATKGATGAVGLGGSKDGSKEAGSSEQAKEQMTPEQQDAAKKAQEKGSKGVDPIKEGESDAEIAKRLIAIV